MKGPMREPGSFYYRYRRRHPQPIGELRAAGSLRKRRWIKEVLIHVGLFVAGLVVGTAVGLITLSLLERWLSNGG